MDTLKPQSNGQYSNTLIGTLAVDGGCYNQSIDQSINPSINQSITLVAYQM